MNKRKEQQQNESPKDTKKASTKEIVLEAELDQVKIKNLQTYRPEKTTGRKATLFHD